MQIFRRRSKKSTPPREAPKQTPRRAPDLKDLDSGFDGSSVHRWENRPLDLPPDFHSDREDSGESPLEYEIRTNTGFLHKQALKGGALPFYVGDLVAQTRHEDSKSKGKDSTYSSNTPESLLDGGGSENLAPSESSKAESSRATEFKSTPLPELRQEIQQTFERASSAALVWLNAHAKEINEDGKLNSSLLSFSEFLDCAFTLYQAGKTGWHAESPADHFASAIDQAGDPTFREDLIRQLLLRHHTMDYNDPVEMDASVSALGSLASASSSTHTLLPAMPEPPPLPADVAPFLDPPVIKREEAGVPSLLAKDIFLDWHSKFAFSQPVRLASKEILPTIVLPALAAWPAGDLSAVGVSQERQSLLDELALETPSGSTMQQPPSEEMPHPETYQPHPGLLKLGSSLYTSQILSDSPLNMPRQAEAKPAPIQPRPSTSTSLLSTSKAQDMQLYDAEDEGYAIYGSGSLKKAILDGEVDPHTLIDQARYAEENSIQLLAPMVQSAVLQGKFDVVIQLAQRNIQCIDVALQIAEETGKFSLVKYLDLLKQQYPHFAGLGGRRPSPLPALPVGPSKPQLPQIPPRPKSIRADGAGNDAEVASQGGARLTLGVGSPFEGRLSPGIGSRPGQGILGQDDDGLLVDADDSEAVWKLRAIYLLLLMIVLSETAEVSVSWDNSDSGLGMSETSSSQGWNSGSSTSSRQSSQAPVDAQGSDYTATGTGLSGFTSRPNSGTPSGSRRPGSENNRRKKSEDDDSDGSDGNRRPRNRRPSNLRSLGRRYACPFAKADPDNNVTCWTINRQNLAGVKEHMKRFHFRGTLPADIRAARTWDDVFDCIAPDWGGKPRPSPYVDMLDIFQRAVRPSRAPRVAASGAAPAPAPAPVSGLAAPQQSMTPLGQWGNLPQQQQHIPAASLPSDQGLGLFNEGYVPAPQDPRTAMFYNPSIPGASRTTSPASASVAGFDAGNYGMLPLSHMAATGAGPSNPVTAAQASLSQFELANTGIGLQFDDLFKQLTGPEIAHNISPQDISSQFQQAKEWLHSDFDIGHSMSADAQWLDIMDRMEPAAPVQTLPPVFESSPEPQSAVSNDTLAAGSFHQHLSQWSQPQHQGARQTTTSPPSVVSSASNVSASLVSLYPPSSTSMGIHNAAMTAAAPQMFFQASQATAPPAASPANSTPLPIATYLGSSPASTINTVGSKDKKYQLMISRNPTIPNSTERPGHRKFSFDTFEEFLRTFDAFMMSEFTDPMFGWENWELLNPINKLRLQSAEDVVNDLDFTFVAHNQTRAGLYLVPKDI
ncbi:hypothetical protein Dda_6660 [Drechslerella dactyloides]|uniref:Uncharacterized protein n=1 Tax=Drechslerella dactyloides TaxID=74499 RepID=A0AAD6IU50_DREDA|nr:hypothetical protein Dda_6660 [Drechslerella dactyloides]